MEEVKRIILEGHTYALRDDSKLPQPAEAQPGQLLQVKQTEEGQVTAIEAVSVETLVQAVVSALPDGDEVRY